MFLTQIMLIAGSVTLLWSLGGLALIHFHTAESVFTENRPRWLTGLTWLYLTLTILVGYHLFENPKPMVFLAAIVTTVTTAKFLLIYSLYLDSRHYFVMLWRNRIAMSVVLTSAALVGVLMLYISRLVA